MTIVSYKKLTDEYFIFTLRYENRKIYETFVSAINKTVC